MSYQLIDPGESLDFAFDWSLWLAEGDSISTRQWTIEPTGPTLTGATSATVKVSGCTLGIVYRLAEDVVTANGVSGKRSITLRCDLR